MKLYAVRAELESILMMVENVDRHASEEEMNDALDETWRRLAVLIDMLWEEDALEDERE